ncbi:C-C motif chemokine 4 homolog [Catharus ustulatus]|uniref:Chemokine interleukin-8-like domain-containing protein n=1 Tax=Catharus ustulatus TaxID=91951 RepID=A0A8C3URC3_CATUS|nr:C-C motif chemokine 4 homolog [Catharus ustulatus]
MKVSAAGLALLLISASFSQTFSGPAGLNIPICCFTYTQHKIPRKLIQRHYTTSSSCPQSAIVFVTKEGRQICANPKHTWVQSYLKILKQN